MIDDWHKLKSEEILERFQVSRVIGRRNSEIEALQRQFGLNVLPPPVKRSLISIFIHQFLSPLIYLLFVASAVAFLIGDEKDAFVILVVVILNAIIGATQEGRAEQSLESLRQLSKLKARVLRDGKEIEIESSDLVPGDIFMVAAGDKVPTDARLLEASSLASAEAALTGESVPVVKNETPLHEDVSLADRSNMIYAGTHITAGRGIAVAIATGEQNEIGRIARLATSTIQPKTQLEIRIHKFGQSIVLAAIALFFLVLGIGWLRGVPFSEIFMIAVSQMVSLVPEGLPVALTIALAVGVQRMARRKTIVRRLSAVETLGSTSVICTDKTGTLTKNEMTVVSVYLPISHEEIRVTGAGYSAVGRLVDIPTGREMSPQSIEKNGALVKLIEASVCCNDSQIQKIEKEHSVFQTIGDPTESALLVFAEKAGFKVSDIRERCPRVAELPFDSSTKMMATEHVVGGNSIVYIKGAPEELLSLCGSVYGAEALMGEEDRDRVRKAARQMADSALRVLAVGVIPNIKIDELKGYSLFQGKVEFLGLLGELDPPREEAAAAVQECVLAGVRPVMVTGDHKATAVAIARALGISKDEGQAIDGSELDRLTDEEFDVKVDQARVFARVHPSQKLKIVQAFQRKGHVVAMTGDGVNDAPALVQANVGVAMGIAGTEVAKEAAKIVITDDNFSTIVAAISEGRLVYQNIKKLILFLFVTSIDEVLVLFLALIFGYPPPLAAVQILWINLVSESALTVNLIMEPHEGNEMRRPPIPVHEPLLDRGLLARMPLMVLASVISTFGWFLYRTKAGVPVDVVQSETFTVLVVCQWFNVLNCRSATQTVFSLGLLKNPWLIGGLAIANVLHFLVIYWEPLAQFFHAVPIATDQFFAIGAVASLVLWVEEFRKFLVRKKV